MAETQEEYKDRLRKFSDRNHSESATSSSSGKPAKAKMPNSASKISTQQTPEKQKDSISPAKQKSTKMTEFETLKTMIETLTTTVTRLATTVSDLKSEIADIKTSKLMLTGLQEQVTNNKSSLETVAKQTDNDAFQVKLLTAIVIRQEAQIQSLSKEVETFKKQSRAANIVIKNLLENENESELTDRIKIVHNFFKEKMEIQTSIPIRNIYRFGGSNSHALMVVLDNPEDKSIIFANSSKLKGKTNARRQLFFVSSDQTEQEREDRKYMQHLKKENLDYDDDDRLKISLKKGKLFVNNEIFKPEIEAPTARDILTMTDQEVQMVKEAKTYESGTHDKKGSEFFCHFQRVNNTEEIQQGLTKMKIKYGDASLVVSAYRLYAKAPKAPLSKDSSMMVRYQEVELCLRQ